MSIRDLENASIRAFLKENAHLLGGRVLDYGCGKQPYRDLIEAAGGEYYGWDSPNLPASCVQRDTTGEAWQKKWDVIICTQVIQYVETPVEWLTSLRYERASSSCWLLITGPTNWPVVEQEDLHRLTVTAARRVLAFANWNVESVSYRASVRFENEDWPLGWWAKARA